VVPTCKKIKVITVIQRIVMPPPLSKALNCWGCGSPHHHKSVCPRVDRSCPAPKVARVKQAGIPAAEAAAATKKAADKKAAAAAARKLTCQAKKAARANIEAANNAVYVALAAVIAIPATAGSYREGRWAVAADVCISCARPRKGCMCVCSSRRR
jgi:hypothetical protein